AALKKGLSGSRSQLNSGGARVGIFNPELSSPGAGQHRGKTGEKEQVAGHATRVDVGYDGAKPTVRKKEVP
ncbi:MAG: hypothetical protein QMC33_03815, partial [Octadecabacter sp.]